MDRMPNDRVVELARRHQSLNEQIDRIERRAYLTPNEQREVADMKKEKLRAKDLLSTLRR